MTEATASYQTDTSDMRFPHGMLRDSLAQAGDLVRPQAPSDSERVELVCSFYQNVLAFLQVHHGAEDELLWPLLRQRAPEEQALLDRMESQHAAVEQVTQAADRAIATYRSGPTEQNGANLVAALRRLAIELDAHLLEEEREILPLAAAKVSAEEWGALPGHAARNFQGDKSWLVVGLLFEQMTPAEKATTLEHFPGPFQEMWASTGERDYRAVMAELGGSNSPRT